MERDTLRRMTEVPVAGTGPPTSQNIRAELARAGITQERMAEILGLSRAAWGRRLKGDVDWRLAELLRIADKLGVPLSRLTRNNK